MPENVTTILSELETGINAFASDSISALKAIDFQTVALVGLSILFVVFLVDLLSYVLAVYKGTDGEFTPYSRSIAVMAADAWDNRRDNNLDYYYEPYVGSRSLDSVAPIIDSISNAIRKWD